MVGEVAKQQWIKDFIVDVLEALFFGKLGDFCPLLFHVTVEVVLHQLHYMRDTQAVLADLNSELLGQFVFVVLVVAEHPVFKYLLVVVVTEDNIRANIVNGVFIHFLEDRGVR